MSPHVTLFRILSTKENEITIFIKLFKTLSFNIFNEVKQIFYIRMGAVGSYNNITTFIIKLFQ